MLLVVKVQLLGKVIRWQKVEANQVVLVMTIVSVAKPGRRIHVSNARLAEPLVVTVQPS